MGQHWTVPVLAATRPPPTPPPKLPHRRMQRPLPEEVLAVADSLQELLLSSVDPTSGVPPIYLIHYQPSFSFICLFLAGCLLLMMQHSALFEIANKLLNTVNL